MIIGYEVKLKKGLITKSSLVLLLIFSAIGAATAQLAVGSRTNAASDAKSKYFDATQLLKDIEYLSSDELEGRSPDRPSIAKARDYVEKRFRESGFQPIGETYRRDFTFKMRRGELTIAGVNFVGQIKGKKYPEKYIVITAHYDHDGIKDGQVYNGADDNASGTAALFAIAKYFTTKKPDHSMMFVAFDAEEKGLQGARHFVANLPVAKESILLNVNVDMISRSDKNELYASGTYHYSQFKPAIEKVRRKAEIKLLIGHDRPEQGPDDWTFQSDHGAFHREKIPFIYFGVEDHEDYHQPTDDFANIHPEFYVKAVETIIEAIKQLDQVK